MCSREEIELKKRLALEKLAQKRLTSPLKPNLQSLNSGAQASPNKPRFNFKESNHSVRHAVKPYEKPKETGQFYGNEKAVTGKCSLIGVDRFVVELSGFSTPAIDVFKSIGSRHYSESWKLLVVRLIVFL